MEIMPLMKLIQLMAFITKLELSILIENIDESYHLNESPFYYENQPYEEISHLYETV